jgi:hypothetical protein
MGTLFKFIFFVKREREGGRERERERERIQSCCKVNNNFNT